MNFPDITPTPGQHVSRKPTDRSTGSAPAPAPEKKEKHNLTETLDPTGLPVELRGLLRK